MPTSRFSTLVRKTSRSERLQHVTATTLISLPLVCAELLAGGRGGGRDKLHRRQARPMAETALILVARGAEGVAAETTIGTTDVGTCVILLPEARVNTQCDGSPVTAGAVPRAAQGEGCSEASRRSDRENDEARSFHGSESYAIRRRRLVSRRRPNPARGDAHGDQREQRE